MTQKISSTNIETSTLISLNGPTIANVSIANSTYVLLDDTAVSNTGGYAIITGSNFVSGAQVLFGNTAASAVTFVDSTRLNVQVPALTAGSYVMYIQNPDGSTAIKLNAITSSPIPVWVTGSTLTNQTANVPISISLSAPSDSNVTFSVANGSSLPSGTTLASNGLFSGTISISTETTYNFSVNAIDAENQEALRSFSVTVQVGDQYFANTVLLLNGETTGANSSNTWIQDISTNKFELSIFGDTRPVGFSPYETVWSNFFDGTGDYLTASSNTAFGFGTGDFTVEGWYYFTGTIGTYQRPWWFGDDNDNTEISSSVLRVGGASQGTLITGGTTLVANRWYHIALTRSSGVYRLWLNGVQEGSSATNSYNSSARTLGIAATTGGANPITGYISNFRILKGTALYTTAFTPSTTPLTVITNTSILTCQSNRLIDNSNNAFTITRNGDVTVSNFGPFTETDVTTGSAYFDGTGDYLTLPNINFASNDFCVECWFYWTTNDPTSYSALFGKGVNDSSEDFCLLFKNTEFYFDWGGGATFASRSTTINTRQWYHVALTRSSGTVKIFLNGVQQGADISVATITNNHTTWYIGLARTGASILFTGGYISDVRFVNGSPVYTSNFTPPTAPLTAVANTSLLTLQNRLGENSNRFIDETGFNHLITRNGNVTQGTFTPFSQTGWSVFLDGSGDYISTNATMLGGSSTSTFTIDGWIFPTTFANTIYVIGDMQPTGSLNYISVNIETSGAVSLYWYDGSAKTCTSTGTLTLNKWNYFAVRVSSNSITIYVNSVTSGQTGTTTLTNRTGTANFAVGAFNNSVTPNAYLSNLRVSTVARTISIPTSAFSNDSDTRFLLFQSNRLINNGSTSATLTPSGNVSVQAFSSFSPGNALYSVTTVGGSAYFDGSGDYLNTPSTGQFAPVGNFTVAWWYYPTTLQTTAMVANYTGNNTTDWSFETNSAGDLLIYLNGATVRITGSTAIKLNQWNYIVVSRSGTTVTAYCNGSAVGSPYTLSGTFGSATKAVRIGAGSAGTNNMFGYCSGVRLIDGTALTGDIPTSPPTNVTGTNLLLNFTNSGVIDYTSKNVLESVGNVRVSTVQTKYDSRSLYFDGTGDYLKGVYSPNMILSGDFTIECWLYYTAHGNYAGIVGFANSNTASPPTSGWAFVFYSTTDKLYFETGTGFGLQTTNTIPSGQWNHVAVVRSGSTITHYLNGVANGSGTSSATFTPLTTDNFVIGIERGLSGTITGYIDDLRITKGFARYTANFTPPTSTFLTK